MLYVIFVVAIQFSVTFTCFFRVAVVVPPLFGSIRANGQCYFPNGLPANPILAVVVGQLPCDFVHLFVSKPPALVLCGKLNDVLFVPEQGNNAMFLH